MLRILIQNDGTGTDENARYAYSVFVNEDWIDMGIIEGHNRADPWWVLAQRVIDDAKAKGEG